MPSPHQKQSPAAERRRERRRRRAERVAQSPGAEQTGASMAPLTMQPQRKRRPERAASVVQIDRDTEYTLVRRDLWRLAIYSVVCFVLMMAVLVFLSAQGI